MSLFNQLGNAPQQQAQAVMDQQQRTVQAPPAQMQTPSQSSKRFMIEDLALDDDEEDHTKSRELKEKTQFASLLKRFRPRNS